MLKRYTRYYDVRGDDDRDGVRPDTKATVVAERISGGDILRKWIDLSGLAYTSIFIYIYTIRRGR